MQEPAALRCAAAIAEATQAKWQPQGAETAGGSRLVLAKPPEVLSREKREQAAWLRVKASIPEERAGVLADLISAMGSLGNVEEDYGRISQEHPFVVQGLLAQGDILSGMLAGLETAETGTLAEMAMDSGGPISANSFQYLDSSIALVRSLDSFPSKHRGALESYARRQGANGDLSGAQAGVIARGGGVGAFVKDGERIYWGRRNGHESGPRDLPGRPAGHARRKVSSLRTGSALSGKPAQG